MAVCSRAIAGEPPPAATGSERRVQSVATDAAGAWYGWQILAADAAGLATGAALTFAIDSDYENRPSDLGLIASAWYGVGALAAPSIHFVHEEFGKGSASLGARTLVPPLAGVLGLFFGCIGHGDFDSKCRRAGITGGMFVGLAGATAFDATVLAFDDVSSPAPPARRWYGWELLALDGAALLAGTYVAIRGPRNEQGEKLAPHLGLWATDYLVGLFGGPIIHLVHGEWQHGLASLGARALIGPMGAVPGLMGHCAASAGAKGCAGTGATFGLLGGLLLVDVFDAFVLGYEELDAQSAAWPSPRVSAGPGFVMISGLLP